MTTMKYLVAALLFYLLSFSAQAQSTFEIAETNNVSDISSYEEALKNADLDQYRYKDTQRVLEFRSGVVVLLLSTNEIKALGITPTADPAEYVEGKREPVCSIAQNGTLVMAYRPSGKHYPKESGLRK